jgi:hypothetical protein
MRGKTWVLFIALAALAGAPQKRRTPVERLNPDLVPYIAEAKASVAIVRVRSCGVTPLEKEQKQQLTVHLDVVEAMRGTLQAGSSIEVSGKRLADEEARFRAGFDQWNVLALAPGGLMMAALLPAGNPQQWQALSMRDIASERDPLAGAIRRAVAIEQMPAGTPGRAQALEDALSSPSDVLQAYAIRAVRGAMPRVAGAEAMARALFSRRALPDARPPLALALASRDFYHYEAGADEANLVVIRALAKLVAGGGPQVSLWTQILGASLTIEFSADPAKDGAMRSALIRGVTDPAPARVLSALEQQLAAGSKDPRVPKLIAAWKAAGHP